MARILAIDDSETFRIEIREILAQYDVIEAIDGVDGIKKLESNSPIDLIICDVNMPNMDGITFCKKIHESQKYLGIPIIMITTESNVELKKEVKNFGVKAWVLKPIDAKSLTHGVKMLLELSSKKSA